MQWTTQRSTLLLPGTDVLGAPTRQNLLSGFLVPVLIVISLWSSFPKSLADLRTVNTQEALSYLIDSIYFLIISCHTVLVFFVLGRNPILYQDDVIFCHQIVEWEQRHPVSNDSGSLHHSTIPVVLTWVWANILISTKLTEKSVHLTNTNICSSI